ncbi:sulfite exporter TauE/SafE family protein [Shewanella sp. GutDb-MelDb]|uniref:sulfite exporter TauE/SafE family protein n=1 Tax=Shewanella sp. GutDb-MelDb TaxID=2058316 RepID=UPI000C7C92B3|nr:sulfite exporter TauE/SafE family protein [Shewanella sp. GutDb-MelDb]PKG56838.1 sulfite exporter TauE/SafE family protein [Shewanella sp. GutDb-MelDb]
MTWIDLLLLSVLGGSVGIIAGLLGVGGGGILVPVLASLFLSRGVQPDVAVHLSLGTAMASIIATTFSSARAHHQKQNVDWKVVKNMVPFILLGSVLAALLISVLNALLLSLFFTAFMGYLSLSMLLNRQPPKAIEQQGGLSNLISVVIGAVSTLTAIGGGSLIVPYLVKQGINIRKAVASSAAIGVSIAIVGTSGYVINGMTSYGGTSTALPWALGFIHLPSVVIISISGFLAAPLGVKLSGRIPQQLLKKLFGLLLFVISLKMLFNILAVV